MFQVPFQHVLLPLFSFVGSKITNGILNHPVKMLLVKIFWNIVSRTSRSTDEAAPNQFLSLLWREFEFILAEHIEYFNGINSSVRTLTDGE